MNQVPKAVKALVAVAFLFATNLRPNDQQEQPTNKYQGQELLQLDDAYCNVGRAALKNNNNQVLLHNQVVQYYVRQIGIELLSHSIHEDAQTNLQELERRLTIAFDPQDLQDPVATENVFSGEELFAIEFALTGACAQALDEKNLGALFFLLAIRRSLQAESIQLLQKSTHPQARTYRMEFSKRLKECQALHHQLALRIAETENIITPDDTQDDAQSE